MHCFADRACVAVTDTDLPGSINRPGKLVTDTDLVNPGDVLAGKLTGYDLLVIAPALPNCLICSPFLTMYFVFTTSLRSGAPCRSGENTNWPNRNAKSACITGHGIPDALH